MPFTKETAKEAGAKSSRKGVPNKATTSLRERASQIVEDRLDRYLEELDSLEGSEFIKAFNQLLEYALPKLQRIDQKRQLEQNNVVLNLGAGINPEITEEKAELIRKALAEGELKPTDTREVIEYKLIARQLEEDY